MALMRFFYDDLCKHDLLFFIFCGPYLFGSSIFSVWFQKRAARAANNSHVCLLAILGLLAANLDCAVCVTLQGVIEYPYPQNTWRSLNSQMFVFTEIEFPHSSPDGME